MRENVSLSTHPEWRLSYLRVKLIRFRKTVWDASMIHFENWRYVSKHTWEMLTENIVDVTSDLLITRD